LSTARNTAESVLQSKRTGSFLIYSCRFVHALNAVDVDEYAWVA